jgi:hypothetical protein
MLGPLALYLAPLLLAAGARADASANYTEQLLSSGTSRQRTFHALTILA